MPGGEDFGKRPTSVKFLPASPCVIAQLSYIERMNLPHEAPVMTLTNVTLFPQALLPLYIFEPRYRLMLAAALDGDRMFCVAMRKPDSQRELPLPVAGLGLIRVSVRHNDGTSHLLLQGVARVTLAETVRTRPYRVARIQPLSSPPCNTVAADALLAKVRELLQERFSLGLPFPFPLIPPAPSAKPPQFSEKDVLGYLDSIADPEQAADLVSCAVLPDATERQVMLETVSVESRLRRLIQFLLEEIRNHRRGRHE
jgi:ATP-dependent Lon protease